MTKQLSDHVEVNTVSVKPDKFQKLRRITANTCREKFQNQKSENIIISSVGSSPSSSPRPENLSGICQPVDAAELYARLTVLIKEENKENRTQQPGDNVQADVERAKISEVKTSEVGNVEDKSMSTEEFYAVSEDILAATKFLSSKLETFGIKISNKVRIDPTY